MSTKKVLFLADFFFFTYAEKWLPYAGAGISSVTIPAAISTLKTSKL
jgi:hypothetical protein